MCHMQDVEQRMISFLRITRDILKDFSQLVNTMMKSKERYGVGFDAMKSINFSDPKSLQELASKLPNEKLGLLLTMTVDFMSIQKDFQNVMTLDEAELAVFDEKLKLIIEKLTKIVDDES